MENQNTNNTQNNIQLNLFISDLAEYNAGNLVGKWFNALTEFEAAHILTQLLARGMNGLFLIMKAICLTLVSFIQSRNCKQWLIV